MRRNQILVTFRWGIRIFGFAVLAIFKIGFSVFVPENFGFSYLGPVSLRSERQLCVSTDLE